MSGEEHGDEHARHRSEARALIPAFAFLLLLSCLLVVTGAVTVAAWLVVRNRRSRG